MRNLILSLLLLPLSLIANIETFEFFHNCSVQKGKVKNTIQVEGIRFFDMSDSRVIFIDGSIEGVYGNNFSTSCGVGIREYFDGFGLGINSYWDYTNESKFAIHQIGFGIELLMDEFTLFYNRNTPLSKDRDSILYEVNFANSSQLGFKHQISDNLFYALSANVCCFNNKIGFKGEIQKTFSSSISIGGSAMYNGDRSPAFSISIGYHFGGMAEPKYYKPTRDRRVCYKMIHAEIMQEDDKFYIVPPKEEKKEGEYRGLFSFLDWTNDTMEEWKKEAKVSK